MWIHISKIASDHRLPEEYLVALAMRNQQRYGVILDTAGPKVAVKAAQKLVAEFQAFAASRMPASG